MKSKLCILIALAACAPPKDGSQLQLVNGRVIDATVVPAAVQIALPIPGQQGAEARCTATWVSSNTIVTAAHCVEERGVVGKIKVVDGLGTGAQSISVIVHPSYRWTGGGADIAVVVFPPNSVDNAKTAQIPNAQPQLGDSISIVGYGKFNHHDPQSGGDKRVGTNTIQKVGSRISFLGSPRPQTSDGKNGTGDDVLNSQGDSGGPMFLGNADRQQIIGVSSTLNTNPEPSGKHFGHYENLLAYRDWLLSTAEKGAVFNGINGDGGADSDPDSESPPDDVQKPVIAGLIDGEGSVYFGFESDVTSAFLCLTDLETCKDTEGGRISLEKLNIATQERGIFKAPREYSPEELAKKPFVVMAQRGLSLGEHMIFEINRGNGP